MLSNPRYRTGLLCSHTVRLRAAFDHRHIFLDPDPEPDVSYAERRRLFELPRSSWEDYSSALISTRGGVFPRNAKRIPMSHEARTILGITDEELPGEEVVRAILRMDADLLWNGGIGTYVKASTDS